MIKFRINIVRCRDSMGTVQSFEEPLLQYAEKGHIEDHETGESIFTLDWSEWKTVPVEYTDKEKWASIEDK